MPRAGEREDLAGRNFGRLTVIRFSHSDARRKSYWLCRCSCGAERAFEASNLKQENSASCGCFRAEVTASNWTTHGHGGETRSPEYESWCAMWARVRAKSGKRFEDYGSRGITVCERWKRFEDFLEDMGPRPAGKSLDRINNDGNYEPGNCRWATDSEQMANQRRSRKYRTQNHPQESAP